MSRLPNYNPEEHTPRLEDAFMTRRDMLKRTGMGMGAMSLAMMLGEGMFPSRAMATSTALPCRVSIYTENGKTKLATLKPTTLLELFNVPELGPVAAEVERELFEAMQEAA